MLFLQVPLRTNSGRDISDCGRIGEAAESYFQVQNLYRIVYRIQYIYACMASRLMNINRDFVDRFPLKLYELFLLESVYDCNKVQKRFISGGCCSDSKALSCCIIFIFIHQIIEVINHVLVYCFGLNAFYTHFLLWHLI